jgi:hypothetical protein
VLAAVGALVVAVRHVDALVHANLLAVRAALEFLLIGVLELGAAAAKVTSLATVLANHVAALSGDVVHAEPLRLANVATVVAPVVLLD